MEIKQPVKVSREDPPWLRTRSSTYAPKTTIYIGDELVERVATLRSRGIDINISAVCKTAIQAACDEAEAFASSTATMRGSVRRRK